MPRPVSLAIGLGHIVWIASIVNIGIGLVIPGFDWVSRSISHVALEAPAFAITHRSADVIIGLAMCGFAVGANAASDRRISFSMVSIGLLGLSMISAGIWTLESPLHLLYNLSIFMIVAPLAFALEFKDTIQSRRFETACGLLAFLHVTMFWAIYAGFIPGDVNGLVQRLWAIPTMGWFGLAAMQLRRGVVRGD